MENSLSLILSDKIYKFEESCSENPFTATYGVGRSLIALSTLSVFVFNDIRLLFNTKALDVIRDSNLIVNRINFFALIGADNLLIAQVISIAILILVISGYIPQLSGILHFWINFSFYNSAILLDGGEQIASILTLLLLPLCILDKRKNHWYVPTKQSEISKVVGHVMFKIIAFQTAFIYLNTAVEKIYLTPEWTSGTAMYYIINNPMFGFTDFMRKILELITLSKFVFFLTWSVLISHLALSYVLFLKRKDKKRFLLAGCLLHGSIAVFMGLYSFSIVMIGTLVLYLLPFDHFKFPKPWRRRITRISKGNI